MTPDERPDALVREAREFEHDATESHVYLSSWGIEAVRLIRNLAAALEASRGLNRDYYKQAVADYQRINQLTQRAEKAEAELERLRGALERIAKRRPVYSEDRPALGAEAANYIARAALAPAEEGP